METGVWMHPNGVFLFSTKKSFGSASEPASPDVVARIPTNNGVLAKGVGALHERTNHA